MRAMIARSAKDGIQQYVNKWAEKVGTMQTEGEKPTIPTAVSAAPTVAPVVAPTIVAAPVAKGLSTNQSLLLAFLVLLVITLAIVHYLLYRRIEELEKFQTFIYQSVALAEDSIAEARRRHTSL
eukprot:Colp12_sorted_trinity150504_noHs@24016